MGKLQTKNKVRLAELSGELNWRRHHRLNKSGDGFLPYTFSTIDERSRTFFQFAKQLQSTGTLQIRFKKGENWFVLNPQPEVIEYVSVVYK
jgi:hypothetical protein